MGRQLILWDKLEGSNQMWKLDTKGRLLNKKRNEALDIFGSNEYDGAKVTAWTPHNGDNQKWRVEGGYIISQMNGKVVQANALTKGSVIEMWEKEENPGKLQKWKID